VVSGGGEDIEVKSLNKFKERRRFLWKAVLLFLWVGREIKAGLGDFCWYCWCCVLLPNTGET